MVRTFQNGRLFAGLSALENVLVVLMRASGASLFGTILRSPRFRAEEATMREHARSLLRQLGMEVEDTATSLPCLTANS